MENNNLKSLEKRKVIISIIFGLAGFVINFYSIDFMQFPEIKVSILLGLLFPLIIALFWGWKYGLISALAGGCQTMWVLWYNDGYGIIYSVPIYTLWIVWHGWWANYRESHEHRWYHSMYVVELIFRFFSELGFLTIFRLLVSMNPPIWDSNITNNIVTLHWMSFVARKHLISALVLLLFSDLALHFKPMRRFFGKKISKAHQQTSYLVSAALVFGCLLWFIQAIMDYHFFHKTGEPFLDILFVNIPPCSLFTRHLFLFSSLVAGLLLSRYYLMINKKDELFRATQHKFETFLNTSPDLVMILNLQAEIDYISPSASKYFDKPQSMLHQSIYKYVSSGWLDTVRRNFQRGLNGEEIPPYETALTTRKEGKVFFEIHGSNLKGKDEVVTGRIAIMRDITARKTSQKIINEKNAFLNLVIDSMPSGIVIVESNGTIAYVNPQAQKILELDLNKESKTYNDVSWQCTDLQGNELSSEELPFSIVRKTNAPLYNFEHGIITKSGIHKILKVNSVPIYDAEGSFKQMISALEDITQSRKTLEELENYKSNLESLVIERTADLEEKNDTLQHYLNIFQGREFRIKELRDKVKILEDKYEKKD